MSIRNFRTKPTDRITYYPRLMGLRGGVATMHHLSADAAREVLGAGGNAVDAAVAAVLCEGLLNPQMVTIGGECPMLVRMAGSSQVHVINGNLAAPGRATPEEYAGRGLHSVPDEGILAAGVPATMASLFLALQRFGTMSFAEVANPAIELARDGFAMHRGLLNQEGFGLRDLEGKFRQRWPSSAELYLPGGHLPEEGSLFKNRAFASVLEFLSNCERSSSGDRVSKISAAHDVFYRGDIASTIVKFSASRDGLLELSDFSRYEAFVENPYSVKFGDAELFKCGFWTQGPTILQCLSILKRFDLKSMGHNTADYLHILLETIKLVYADREQYYGDGTGVAVPAKELLGDGYAEIRSKLIDDTAIEALVPGDPLGMRPRLPEAAVFASESWGHGTVHVDVVDKLGNMIAATPSGAWIKSSEVIPEVGFPLGNRLMTFYLGPTNHPNIIAPHKRPRITLSPSLAFRKGRPWMVFGSMGGDQQDQWQLQFFLNRVVFGMTIQEAIEAPKLSSDHFPGFFAPHTRFPNKLRIEPRVSESIREELRSRGHLVHEGADWSEGYLAAVEFAEEAGFIEAGCDPRGWKSEIFPMTALCW